MSVKLRLPQLSQIIILSVFNCDFVFFIVFVVNSVSLIFVQISQSSPNVFMTLVVTIFAPVLDWGKRLKYSNSPELIS
ncbi:Uncharacterised protein [Shigella sonnei]|nr:Uncharacterised protein [Shigella sonnei]